MTFAGFVMQWLKYAYSEDSDHAAHINSLISLHGEPTGPLLLLECPVKTVQTVDVQADLGLCWTHLIL